MTPEQQRIAIAEACGYFHAKRGVDVWYERDGGHVVFGDLPDYLNDLNAMNEAVGDRCNNSADGSAYGRWLVKIVFGYDFFVMPLKNHLINSWELMRLSNATAAQRAEAFLRTLGKWEES